MSGLIKMSCLFSVGLCEKQHKTLLIEIEKARNIGNALTLNLNYD